MIPPILISGQKDPEKITNKPAKIIPAEAIASFLQLSHSTVQM